MPSSRCGRSATSWRLVPFSHRSASRIFIRQPGCIPSPMVTQDGDHQFGGGEKQAGLRPLPRPQLQGSSSSLLGRGASRGPAFAWAGVPLLPPASGGGNHPPALRRRHPPAKSGKANCCCPARVQHSVLCPGDGGQPHRGISQHVVRREGGTRVLGRSRSRFHGEDRSEDLLVRFGAPALAGAALVDRRTPPSVLTWWQLEKASPPSRSSAPPTDRPPTLWL